MNIEQGKRVVPLVVVTLLTIGLTLVSRVSGAGESKYEQQRRMVLEGQMRTVRVEGKVVDVGSPDRVVTTIRVEELAAQEIGELDNVRVYLGEKVMRARLLSTRAYLEIMADRTMKDTLDVDIVCLITGSDRESGLVVLGLGGGLVEWTGVHAGMPVAIEKDQI